MAVAEILIRKAALLRTKEKRNAAAGEMLAENTGGLIEAPDRVLQLTEANGGRSNNESAILDGLSDSLELFGAGKQRRGAHGGTRLAKS
jgi:hypothetical protein